MSKLTPQDQSMEFLLYTAPHAAIEGKIQTSKQISANCPRITLKPTMRGSAYE